MKPHSLILLAILFKCILSYGQVNHKQAFKEALQHSEVGKEIYFSQTKGRNYDSLVLVYLGDIETINRKKIKILTSRWYWGLSPRATSRIILFNQKNQYLGDYYLTIAYDVPDKIEGTSLVFINKKESECTPNLESKISFRNGIPKRFFLKSKEQRGDIYTFAQNL